MATILITGANRGIGLALVQRFVERGDDVIAVCREASDELAETGARVETGVDVTDGDSLRDLAGRLDEVRIDVLVNNAGVMRSTRLDGIESQLDDFRLQFEVNSLAPLRVTSALLGRMGEGGRVAIVTSRMGSIADNDSGGSYGYRMSKAAVNAAGKSLAVDLESRGIAVALLHPGYVRTDMTGHSGFVDSDESAAGLVQRIEEMSLETTGRFLHANGEELPW